MSDPGSFEANGLSALSASQVTKPETTVPSDKPNQEESFAPRFAHLAKKERELQKRAEEWKREKETYQTQLKEYEELKQWKAKRESTPEDIAELLESRGLNFEKVTDYYLQGGKPSPEDLIARTKRELEEKIDSFTNERLESDKKEAETKAKEKVDNFKQQLAEYASKNNEKYELIAATSGSEEIVFNVMDEYFQKYQRVMSVDEACEAVEAHLETQEYERISKVKKLRDKFGPLSEQEPTRGAEPNAPGETSGPTTLTNRMTQAGEPKRAAPMSKEELNKKAAALIGFV